MEITAGQQRVLLALKRGHTLRRSPVPEASGRRWYLNLPHGPEHVYVKCVKSLIQRGLIVARDCNVLGRHCIITDEGLEKVRGLQ